MAKSIEPNLEVVGKYLKVSNDAIFTIPEYQRAYSWSTTECEKLWNDIEEFMSSGIKDPYFFGTIIINCQNQDSEFALIDGQQRTISFLLLLKALLISINDSLLKDTHDEESAPLFRGLRQRRKQIMGILYRTDDEEIEDLPNYNCDREICDSNPIIRSDSVNERYRDELIKILKAVTYEEAERAVVRIPYKQKNNKFTQYFKNFMYFFEKAKSLPPSQLNVLTKTIIEKCEVIEIKSWQVEQAITMFNSLNSAGLPLYDSDIIAAALYAVADKQQETDNFKELWTELLSLVDCLESKNIADIDSLLLQQMYCERAKNKEIVSDAGAINITTPGLRKYYIEINKRLLENPIDFCKKIINLAKIWNKVGDYPEIQVLLKLNNNFKLFLAGYFERFDESQITEDSVSSVVRCFLRLFAILEIVDAGYSSKGFKTFLFTESLKFIDSDFVDDEIVKDFDNHINKNWNRNELSEDLKGYENNGLVYLNEYLFALQHEKEFLLSVKYDIEHIMPNSGKNLKTIQHDAGMADEEEFRQYVNMLGNKILLEERINRSIGNEWFRTKVSTTLNEKTGYIDSTFPIAKSLVTKYKNNPAQLFWGKNEIKDATEKASSRILNFVFGNT